jgi:hypothetical protein
LDWKAYYARERERLGRAGLERLLERAPRVELPERGALVFPHTRLETSGELPAAAALACVRSGRESVLALGVLHGARAAGVARGVHHAGSRETLNEFSLDGFAALLELAAEREGRKPPRLLGRFPALVGERPGDLPGLPELERALAQGAALVATADPIHHGVGYGTPSGELLRASEPRTRELARASVERGFELLARGDHAAFLEHAEREKSDFRDPGPVLATLLASGGRWKAQVLALELVDYAVALEAQEPTWVAGALVEVSGKLS